MTTEQKLFEWDVEAYYKLIQSRENLQKTATESAWIEERLERIRNKYKRVD